MSRRTDIFRIDIEGLETLDRRIEKAAAKLNDLSPLWELFASDFYKDQKRRFSMRGPGEMKDLSPAYKIRKQRIYGFLYPILFATGELADSLLSRDAPGSVCEIRPLYMTIGTRVPHAAHHHNGGRTRRPLWDDRPENPMFKRWERMADVFLEKAVQGAFDDGT